MELCPLQRHSPGHDQADVAAAQDHHVPAGHQPLHIHQPLGGTGGIDARRAAAGDVQGPPGPLPAAHGQDHRIGAELHQARLPARQRQHPVRRQVQHHGVQQVRDVQLPDLAGKPPGVLRPGKLPGEGVQAEARVDALVQNAAQLPVPLDDQQLSASA